MPIKHLKQSCRVPLLFCCSGKKLKKPNKQQCMVSSKQKCPEQVASFKEELYFSPLV